MRLITIDIAQGKIDLKSFSPGYSVSGRTVRLFYETDSDSQFTYTVDLTSRSGLGCKLEDTAATDPSVVR